MVIKHTQDNWHQTLSLVERLLQSTSDLSFSYNNDKWSVLIIVSLNQSNKRLNSVAWLLRNADWDSGAILTRSMFELSANLTYIFKDIEKRLPEYLEHGNIPITAEEIQKLQQEMENGNTENVLNMIPTKSWKFTGELCSDLGEDWLNEYKSFYRYASIPSHAGAFTLGKSFLQLLRDEPLAEEELSKVLITAVAFHLRVAKIVAGSFPTKISIKKLNELDSECNKIGHSLGLFDK